VRLSFAVLYRNKKRHFFRIFFLCFSADYFNVFREAMEAEMKLGFKISRERRIGFYLSLSRLVIWQSKPVVFYDGAHGWIFDGNLYDSRH
jgi:hypothetical protein